MAPPRHRRPGFSRRAQYGLFAGYVVAVVGILVAIGLVIAAQFDPQGFSLLRGAATDAASPVAGAGRSATGALSDAGAAIAAYWNAGSQNAALRRELASARARLIAADALAFENARLRRLAHLVEATPQQVVVARIIGSSASSTRRVATLAAGALQGVRPGEPVRAAEGLVGRVIETGHFSARVLLLTDLGSTVPVRLVRSGIPALATGRGDGTIDVRALASGLAPFRRGDLLVTSGTGGVYPPDVPVAVVTQVSRDSASAWPLADPAALDYAVVLRSFEPDLPPPPAALAK